MFSLMSTLLNAPLSDAVRKKKEEEDRRVAGELPASLPLRAIEEKLMMQNSQRQMTLLHSCISSLQIR